MATEQETLIYIEDQEKKDASVVANSFAHKDTKNRAYINTLGADLALKYLASENIDVSNTYNIHSIKKILEEMDISDIMLPNIHIDVRVVFDENVIFIPKSHFEYNLVPDIYLVFNLAKDFSHVKFLGFFEPKLINKNNANDKYYFIEKEKLNSPSDLTKFIESYSGSTKEALSQEVLENSERIIISMADNDISEDDKKYLIKQLAKSAELRDKFIEYENFETLSYKAMTDPQIKRKESTSNITPNEISLIDEIDNIDNLTEDISINNQETTYIEDELNNIEELDLQPLNDTINEPIAETTEEDSSAINNENSFIETIGEDIIEGALTAGTAAGAALTAGEILNTSAAAETTLNIAEAGLDIVNSGIEISKDLLSNDNSKEETISFDNIDTTSLDNIDISEEKFEDEKITLTNIEEAPKTENQDYIEQVDNKISFDDVKTDNILEEPVPFNFDEEAISLTDIDTTNIAEEPAQQIFDDEKISFDNIETSDIKNSEEIEPDLIDNVISFDDVETDEVNELPKIQEKDSEVLSFDNIDESLEQTETDINSFMDDTISFDDDNTFEPLEETEQSDSDNENTPDTVNEEIENQEEYNEEIPEPEIVEDISEDDKNREGFGNNLLENLSSDNLADISIEDLGIDENSAQDAENISSNDLLAQIDDVLNASTKQETDFNASEPNAALVENQEEQQNTLDEIPDISELASVDEILADNTTSNNEENSEAESNDIAEDVVPLDSIDELLNFEDGVSPEADDSNISDEDNIGVLFNDTDPNSDAEIDSIQENIPTQENIPPQIPGAALLNKDRNSKKTLFIAAALVTVLAATAAFVVFKPKNDNSSDIEPITPTTTEATNTSEQQTSTENTDNILATNAPDINKTAVKDIQKKQVTELKNTPVKPKQTNGESYLSVNRLVWDVPGNLSYSTKMQNYLRTAGKSIKLSLSADLLLATEYAYTNQVKVSLKLNKDGNIQDAHISSSSGSTQIDNIVLQSVKDTLNVVKPPSDEIKTPDFNLSLIIYF